MISTTCDQPDSGSDVINELGGDTGKKLTMDPITVFEITPVTVISTVSVSITVKPESNTNDWVTGRVTVSMAWLNS
ncbi:MAG: hypothetical protein WAV05_18250, partial [Anaerolineales bacterium]